MALRQMQVRPSCRLAWVLSFAILGSVPCSALDPGRLLSQSRHTSWTSHDGFSLPPVSALAQSEDGYLWIGTQRGLWRFDGVQFTKWTPHSGPGLSTEEVWSLQRAQGGGLWIGTASGISRLDHDKLTNYPQLEPRAQGGIRSIWMDASQGVWAGSMGYESGHLLRLTPQGYFAPVTASLPDSRVTALYEDRQKNLWVGTRAGLCRWQAPNAECYLTNPPLPVHGIANDREGHLVVATGGGIRCFEVKAGKLNLVLPGKLAGIPNARNLLTDSDGGLWVGTFSEGLYRGVGSRIERYTRRDGLSGSTVQALLEDTGGNVWVGTRAGLDRFSDPRVSHISTLEGLSDDMVSAVCAGRDGEIWVGTNHGLNRIADSLSQYGTEAGLPSASILSLFQDARKRLWVGTMRGIAVGKKGRFQVIPGGAAYDHVTAIQGDATGRIWIADARAGLLAIDGESIRSIENPVQRRRDIYSLVVDRQSRLWIGYYGGGLAVLDRAGTQGPGEASGLPPDPVTALFSDHIGILWVGSGSGLARRRAGRWTTWTAASGLPPGGVRTIEEDSRGALWLNTERGLLRCDEGALASQPDGSPRAIACTVYGPSDGMRPEFGVVPTQPRSASSRDGRLWFATEEGIAVVDPARLRTDTVTRRVSLDLFRVDGNPVRRDKDSRTELSVRGKNFQFDFGAPALESAESIRFRYQLQNWDSTWIEGAADREAHYSNLPPRRYVFRVMASNRDGAWSQSAVEIAFQVRPAFYQAGWFYGACTAAALGLIWFEYRRRMYQLAHQFEIRLAERLAERNRIARELHDTLLQSVVGVSLQLSNIAKDRSGNPQSDCLEWIVRARRHIDTALQEARRSVWELRSSGQCNADFGAALKDVAMSLTADSVVDCHVSVRGRQSFFPNQTEDQLLRIAREAIHNSIRHAQCTRIDIDLHYTALALQMIISDNGVGMEREILRRGRSGHFGLQGMQERAESIGAEFSVSSEPGKGCAISVVLPQEGHTVEPGRAAKLLAVIRTAIAQRHSGNGAAHAGPPTAKRLDRL